MNMGWHPPQKASGEVGPAHGFVEHVVWLFLAGVYSEQKFVEAGLAEVRNGTANESSTES